MFSAVFLVLLHYVLFFILVYIGSCLALLIPAIVLAPIMQAVVGRDAASDLFDDFLGVWLPVFAALVSLISIAVIIARPSDPYERRVVSVLKKLVSGGKDALVRELVIDRSGLIVRRTLVRTYLPWRDIAQVGVLQPERGSSNQHRPATRHKRKHVLVVRLRPEVPAPGLVSVLSDEHRQLGYLGLCTVESLGSSCQEMTSALERFAGGKLVHNSRQFLDRDPRLRPDMV